MATDLFYRVAVAAGSATCDVSGDLASVVVEEVNDKPVQLSIELTDPNKVFSHALREGMDVEVDLGRVDDHSLIFRGSIYRAEGGFPDAGLPTLKLLAYDRSMRMGLRKRNRPWISTALDVLVRDIARPYFGPDVSVSLHATPRFSATGVRQQEETDLAFLARLAEQYGCEMFVSMGDTRDVLHFDSLRTVAQAQPQVTLYYDRAGVRGQLLSFQANSDVSSIQLPRVFSTMDVEAGQPTEIMASTADGSMASEDAFFDENLTQFRRQRPARADELASLLLAATRVQQNLRDQLGHSEREIGSRLATDQDQRVQAQNQFSTSSLGQRATGLALGDHRLHAHAPIELANLGGRFSGTWFLTKVRHVLDARGYQTEFECQR